MAHKTTFRLSQPAAGSFARDAMASCNRFRDCRGRHFEISLETPQTAPLRRQVEALAIALKTILVEYRYLMAIAQNI